MNRRHLLSIVLYASALWLIVWSISPYFQIDTTNYMVMMLHYAGYSYGDACREVYTSSYAAEAFHSQEAVARLQNEGSCTNILRFFKSRVMYPLLASLIFRLTGSVHALGAVSMLSYTLSGVLLYRIFSYTIAERHSLYLSLIFLTLPIVVRKVGVLYLTDSLSLLMWLACTLLYYRHLKHGKGLLPLMPLLLLYVGVRVNVFPLIFGFIVTSLMLRRYRDAKLLAAAGLLLFAALTLLMGYVNSYGLLDHYIHTFYTLGTDAFIDYERPDVGTGVLVSDYATRLVDAFVGAVLRLCLHLNVLLLAGFLGYVCCAERVERALFAGQVPGTLTLLVAFPYPDSRFLVYAVPAILYFSYFGFRRITGWAKEKRKIL